MKSIPLKLPSGAKFRAGIRDNSTIRTVREELSKQIKIPESHINLNLSHRLRNLQNPTPIRSLGINPGDDIDVSIVPPRLSFQYGNTAPIQLPFTIDSTVATAKKMLAPRFHITPDKIKLTLCNNELTNNQLLRNIHIPLNIYIQIFIDKSKAKSSLIFMMQHEAYVFEFPDETTVAQIKDELMKHADKATISLQLFYNGLYLDDNAILKDLDIKPKSCIIVESEMLEREDFIKENNSTEDDLDENALLDRSTHASRARTAIYKRRNAIRQMLKQSNSNRNSSQKVPIIQPDFSKTAPTSSRSKARKKPSQNNLSQTLSNSLGNYQEENALEEEEGMQILTENQSIGTLPINQSSSNMSREVAIDSKVSLGNMPMTQEDNIQIEEEEEDRDETPRKQSSAALSGIASGLANGLTNSNENNEDLANVPATLEENAENVPVTLEENAENAPATLEDSQPVEDSSGANLPGIASGIADGLANIPATLEEDAENVPVTLEENDQNGLNLSEVASGIAGGLANSDEAGAPATLEDSQKVEDFNDAENPTKVMARGALKNMPATLEANEEDANAPATLEDSQPVGDGGDLSKIASGLAGGLTNNNEEEDANVPATLEANEEDANVPATLEANEEDANVPATLEANEEDANVPATLEANEEDANVPATLEANEEDANVPATLEANEEDANVPATLEDSQPVGDGGDLSKIAPGLAGGLTGNTEEEGAGVPATLEENAENVPVTLEANEEDANVPATLEDSQPVGDGGDLSKIASGLAGGLTNNTEEEGANEENVPATLEANEEDANAPVTLEDSQPVGDGGDLSKIAPGLAGGLTGNTEEEGAGVPATLEANEEDANVPATLEEREVNGPATPEENGDDVQAVEDTCRPQNSTDLSGIASGLINGLTNAGNNNGDDEPIEEQNMPATLEANEEDANAPATLEANEENVPATLEANEEDANAPATLEDSQPVGDGGDLSKIAPGLAGGLTGNTEEPQEPENPPDENEAEARNAQQDEQGGLVDLSKIISGNTNELTKDQEQNEPADDQESTDKKGGIDLSRIISGNAGALAQNGDDGKDSKALELAEADESDHDDKNSQNGPLSGIISGNVNALFGNKA